ncbi:lipopolysaccharide export system protein LptA [Alkalispirillum mobile]|uniref:Lipopolysaccharide export system protein LptA n=1 Tax=Alkalispirillum mobile TaxID=85925 RepID=A0A498BTJ5_9GAMM|nr:lipopolysaccharide transport periplasmic protein LptA [Alkalispirillum mobile]RLK46269.1 lipopolysaccharide export system protein LptA [Alkalispirillum mobile]
MNCRNAAAALVTALTCLVLITGAQARTPDREQPIDLESNRAEIDNVRGISTYTGDVVLTQGSMVITGDRMVVHTREADDRRVLDRIEVDGSPATYEQLPEDQTDKVHAEAPRMEYYSRGPQRIYLLQGAELWQRENRMSGEEIRVNLETQEAQAEGREDRRTRTIFFPAEETDDP